MILLPLPSDPLLAAVARPAPLVEGELGVLRPALRGLIARLLGQHPAHPDVEDATQETLRRLLEGHERLRPGEPLRPWAFGVARHVALDARRARTRAAQRHGGDPHEQASATDAPDPESQALTQQRAEALQAALAQLPEGQRKALLLFHAEGLSYPEIAARLGLPLGTVATWITRGRKALAAACAPEMLLWNFWTTTSSSTPRATSPSSAPPPWPTASTPSCPRTRSRTPTTARGALSCWATRRCARPCSIS